MFGSQKHEREKGILDIIKDDVAKKESEYCQGLKKVFDRFPRANIEETLRNLS